MDMGGFHTLAPLGLQKIRECEKESVQMDNEKLNPYEVPPDDLPEGYTPTEKPVSLAVIIWDKLPQILIYAGLCVVILGVIWGCHHG